MSITDATRRHINLIRRRELENRIAELRSLVKLSPDSSRRSAMATLLAKKERELKTLLRGT